MYDHKEIMARLKDTKPGCSGYSVAITYHDLIDHNMCFWSFFVHWGGVCEQFDSFEELDKWLDNSKAYRQENEILFRKF